MQQNSNEGLKQLLHSTAQGDDFAFKSLYDATSPKLLAVALMMMRDSALAEDVLQDTFVQVWHRAVDYHADRGSVFTWLTTIVRYRAIDTLRKRQRGTSSGALTSIDDDFPDAAFLLQQGEDDGDSPPSGPLARAISSEENSNLRDCVDRLSSNQQTSVALAFFRGFTHQELANCLAEPLGTIKSRLRRSLLRLRECLETLDAGLEI